MSRVPYDRELVRGVFAFRPAPGGFHFVHVVPPNTYAGDVTTSNLTRGGRLYGKLFESAAVAFASVSRDTNLTAIGRGRVPPRFGVGTRGSFASRRVGRA